MTVVVLWGVRNILGASQEALVISFYIFLVCQLSIREHADHLIGFPLDLVNTARKSHASKPYWWDVISA